MSERRRRIIEDQVQALLESDPGLLLSANWKLPSPIRGDVDWLALEPRYPRIWICFLDLDHGDPRSSRAYRLTVQCEAAAIHLRVRLRSVFGGVFGDWPIHAWLFVHPKMSRPLRAALELAHLPARITPLDRTDPWFATGWGLADPRTSWDPDRPLILAPGTAEPGFPVAEEDVT